MIIFPLKAHQSAFHAGYWASGGMFFGVFLALASSAPSQSTVFDPTKVIIIKADDYWGNHNGQQQAWTNFVTSSRNLGVKANLGVVPSRIVGNTAAAQWMQEQQAIGDVEFWNHGWDHSTWTTGGTTYWEFRNSGLAFQQTHFSDAQAFLLNTTGRNAIAFGTPYNQSDADTMTVMNQTPAVRLFFTYNSTAARNFGLTSRVATVGIIAESGGTGKPVASTFISNHPNGPTGPISLQFHPAAFTAADLAEYQQIVQFLLNKNYQFMLPAEYVAAIDGTTGTPPNTPPVAATGEISTAPNQVADIDLRTLTSDTETPSNEFRFKVDAAVNGSVVLLGDGHTARFTPAEDHNGAAGFSYTVWDAAEDTRTLLNYSFQPPDVANDASCTDVSGSPRDGTFTTIGTGAYTYTADHPAQLAPWYTQSLSLYQSGTEGGARLICGLSGASVINFKTTNWTAAGWVKRTNTTDQDIVFHLGSNLGNSNPTTPTPDFTLAFNTGANTLSLKNYSSTSLTSTPDVNITTTVPSGEWHHFAVVRNGGTLTLYVDGISAGSDNSFSLDIDPTYTNVAKFGAGTGASAGTTARYFNGSMADLAIFNMALPLADLVKLQTVPVAYLGGLSATNSVSIAVGNVAAWRQFHFETPENIGSASDGEDPDGDGLTNAEEYVFGSNPKLAEAIALTASIAGGAITLSFAARQASGPGYDGLTRRYTVESTTDLNDVDSWDPIPGHIDIEGGNQAVLLNPPMDEPVCFYRLRVRLE
ncbi:MAG: LamG-like jellyroll fold domain-containing protein [Akkermansiaceae bacterium]